jgi:hypothetical protein
VRDSLTTGIKIEINNKSQNLPFIELWIDLCRITGDQGIRKKGTLHLRDISVSGIDLAERNVLVGSNSLIQSVERESIRPRRVIHSYTELVFLAITYIVVAVEERLGHIYPTPY